MARSENQKAKLLVLLDILKKESDAEHPLPMAEILSQLKARGIAAERKSIYDDLLVLDTLGYTVESVKGRHAGYYLDTRLFEMPELKTLVDAVQAARFIPEEKSRALVKKLESTVSRFEAQKLERQTYVPDRSRTENHAVFSAVDMIHTAIAENKRISFRYFKRNEKKEKVLRRDGAFYTVSPFRLAWSDENYYLIAYDGDTRTVRHYRVDKMQSTSMLSEKREGHAAFESFDMALYTKSLFGMFAGRRELVTLECHNRLSDVILDRFGTDVTLIPVGNDCFRVTVEVVASDNFLAYTFGFGEDMRIVAPGNVRAAAASLLARVKKGY